MGLDGVEIVMRTEEMFGIEIPDKIAGQILTPAALVDFVAANVPLAPTEGCLSQQLFYRLRRLRSKRPCGMFQLILVYRKREPRQSPNPQGVRSAGRYSLRLPRPSRMRFASSTLTSELPPSVLPLPPPLTTTSGTSLKPLPASAFEISIPA